LQVRSDLVSADRRIPEREDEVRGSVDRSTVLAQLRLVRERLVRGRLGQRAGGKTTAGHGSKQKARAKHEGQSPIL
jgi:hypothetical protein